MIFETYKDNATQTTSFFVKAFNREAWLQWLGKDDLPEHQHPQDKRWGVTRHPQSNALMIFAGRFCGIICAVTAAASPAI